MERKTFTATALVGGRTCEVFFGLAAEVGCRDTVAGDRMALVIVTCRSSTPGVPGGEPQEPFTAAEAERIISLLELVPGMNLPMPAMMSEPEAEVWLAVHNFNAIEARTPATWANALGVTTEDVPAMIATLRHNARLRLNQAMETLIAFSRQEQPTGR